jgi:hypothetical protein
LMFLLESWSTPLKVIHFLLFLQASDIQLYSCTFTAKERYLLVVLKKSNVQYTACETKNIFLLQVMQCQSGLCAFLLIHSYFWQLQMMGIWSSMMCMYCCHS